MTLSGLWPIDDSWRLLGNLLWDLPIDSLGKNQPYPLTGIAVTVIHSWK